MEGETEKWYLTWLQQKINAVEKRKTNVSFKITPHISPLKYVKTISTLTTPQICHVCDYEGSSAHDLSHFERMLKDLHCAKQAKKVTYILGYSNLTFELWLILHKINLDRMFDSRQSYLAYIKTAFDLKFSSLTEYKKARNFKKILDQLTLEDVKVAIRRAQDIRGRNRNNQIMSAKFSYEYCTKNPDLSIQEIIAKVLVETGV